MHLVGPRAMPLTGVLAQGPAHTEHYLPYTPAALSVPELLTGVTESLPCCSWALPCRPGTGGPLGAGALLYTC